MKRSRKKTSEKELADFPPETRSFLANELKAFAEGLRQTVDENEIETVENANRRYGPGCEFYDEMDEEEFGGTDYMTEKSGDWYMPVNESPIQSQREMPDLTASELIQSSRPTLSIIDLDALFDSVVEEDGSLQERSSIGHLAEEQLNKNGGHEPGRELFDQLDEKEFRPADYKTGVFTESLEASVGYTSLVRQLNESVKSRIIFSMSEAGGSLSPEEARKAAFKKCSDTEEAKRLFKQIAQLPADTISFYELAKLWDVSPRAAEGLWEVVKSEGRKEFESGHFGANAIFPTAQLKKAWDVARYLGIRESLVEEWKPRNGIEIGLIDMLAQTFSQWQYWLEQTVLRSQTQPRMETPEYRRWKEQMGRSSVAKSWEDGSWFQPYVEEKEALDHAVLMADRWHRMYVRTLRQLRDLRRYSPVTINNAKQVNIATDGSKQANIAE